LSALNPAELSSRIPSNWIQLVTIRREATVDDVLVSDGIVGELTSRLRARSPEIEAALAASILEVHKPPPSSEAELIAGLQATLQDGLAFSLAAFERGDAWEDPLPASLVAQVGYVVQMGMPLEELLRGYSAGNTVISRFVAEECASLPPEALAYSIEVQCRVADALIGGLSAEYARQTDLLERSTTQRTTQEVERLLSEESFSGQHIGYRLDAWHIAGIVFGARADQASRLLAEQLGCELLLLPRGAETYWAWWGAPRELDFEKFEIAAGQLGDRASFALGESRHGTAGFRDSHHEARTAIDVLVRLDAPVVRAADALLPATLLRDRHLADLFVDAHLGALKRQKDWTVISTTLWAYFDAGTALGVAAAAIEVDRHTMRRRIRRIEELLGRPLDTAPAELEIALRVDRLLAAELTGRRQA
jgi:hypothetical protein